MNPIRKLPLVAMAAIMLMGAKKPDVAPDPGPQPASVVEFRQKAEAAIVQGFFDPSTAQFQWDRGIVGSWFKPFLSAKIPGWWTCGLVNGKNRMGGYVGFRRFVAVMRNGSIVFTQIGDGGDIDILTAQCSKAIQNGILPLAEVQASAPADQSAIARLSEWMTRQTLAPVDPNAPRFGFSLSVVPDGAYVASVQSGSPADLAHIVPGMVFSRLNGLSLRGLDQGTITKLIVSAEGDVVFDIIGHSQITLRRAGAATVAVPKPTP